MPKRNFINPSDADAGFPIEPPGIWVEIIGSTAVSRRPGLFLDRDGVVIEDRHYIRDPKDVRLIPGAAELIAAANAAGFPAIIVTNQSGIARGMFDWDAFKNVQQEIGRQLAATGSRLDAVIACPFHPDFTVDYNASFERWRKPAPGMIELAIERLNIDTAHSFLVGNNAIDVGAAKAAKLAGAVLVLTDQDRSHEDGARTMARHNFRITIAENMGAVSSKLRKMGLAI